MSSDIDAARAQFTAEELAVLDSHLAQTLPAEVAGLVQRLQHAIEGECGGLAISEAQALAILHYALEPPAPARDIDEAALARMRERGAIAWSGVVTAAPARWVLVAPQGEVMCEPQQYPSQAWAVLRGTYKTTLEGILGYEQAGWTLAAALPQAAAQVVPPKTWFHDAGAQAQCHYCKRYSLDPRTLSDRPPACECGEKLGWSGSFKPPGPEARWSGATRQAEAAGVPPPTAVPPNIVRYTDRFIEVLLAIHGPVSDDLSDSARLACAQVITELLAAARDSQAAQVPCPTCRGLGEVMLPYGGAIVKCPVCKVAAQPAAAPVDALREALHAALKWYRDEALAISINLRNKRSKAVLASVNVLALDAGNRAITMLAALARPQAAAPEEPDHG